ncbi:hypothetical protein CEXT_482831, partial [Caerostris extrusa]
MKHVAVRNAKTSANAPDSSGALIPYDAKDDIRVVLGGPKRHPK